MDGYITNETCIIFGPKYAKPLSPELLSQANYKKIIFSDCKLDDGLFEKYEKYETLENDGFLRSWLVYSHFNQSLGNALNNCKSLTHIIFGACFNKPLGNSLNNCTALTHLTFGNNFNHHLGNSLVVCTELTHLTFDYWFDCPLGDSLVVCTALTHIVFNAHFNQPLGNSLDNCPLLVHIGLGHCFNQKLDLLPNVRSLNLNCNTLHCIDYLPVTIEEIELGEYFNLELCNLPSSIKKIIFYKGCKYNKALNCLPNGLEYLQLPIKYDKQIQNIPRGLSILVCSKNYPFVNDFSDMEIKVETY